MDENVTFGEKTLAPFLSLEELLECIYGDTMMNYDLLMPVLLFLPSFSRPIDVVQCLLNAYRHVARATKDSSNTAVLMNILIIFRCWLRESFAHHDFSDDILFTLNNFLTNEVQCCDYPALSAAGVKVHDQAQRLALEKREVEKCLQHYHEELDAAYYAATAGSLELYDSAHSGYAAVSPGRPSAVRQDKSSSPSIAAAGVVAGGVEDFTAPVVDVAKVPITSNGLQSPKKSFKRTSPDSTNSSSRPRSLTATSRSSISTPADESSPRRKTRASRSLSASSTGVPPAMVTRDMTKNFSHRELAVILTTIELEDGLLTVRPREFVCKRWTDSTLKSVHPDLGGCAHLTRLIESTNQRIAWIADEILHRGTLEGSLAEVIEYFLRVARHALKLNNFNTVFQIISALSMPAIKHLSAAWSGVSSHKKHLFATYSSLCDPTKNYANYRKNFQAAIGQARIPCIQVLLRDIILMETSCPWLQESKISMQKMESLFRLVNLNVFSTTSAALTPHYDVIVTRGSLAARVLQHDSGVLISADDAHLNRGFCSSCIALQESLFYYFRRSSADSGLIMRELSFGSYVRIASDFLSTYASMDLDLSRYSSSSHTSIFSLFSSSDKEKTVDIILEPSDPVLFSLSVTDDAVMGLLTIIKRTSTDLNVLWENSKVADDIENSRLMHRLMRAGLA